MQKTLITLLLFISLGAKGDYWTQKANFPGINRDFCFGFSISNKGYVGGGRDSNLIPVNTFWEYNQLNNTWTQKANFGGGPRWSATGFSVSGKGYVCFGRDTASTNKNDVWQYDPLLNTWMQMQNFQGGARSQATSFVIQNTAYIACGVLTTPLTYYYDLWQYNDTTDTWVAKTSLPAAGRISPIAFAANNKGYLGAGYFFNGALNYPLDFWEYDVTSDTWAQKATFGTMQRTQPVSFSAFNLGYSGTGEKNTGTFLNDFWEYNPFSNQWIAKTNLPGIARDEGVGFSIGNKGYAGLGEAFSLFPNDWWEYTPDSTTGINELANGSLQFTLSPNPCTDYTTLNLNYPNYLNHPITISITDATGKTIFTTRITTSNHKLQTSNFAKGMYTVRVDDGKQSAVKKFVKE